MIFKLWKLKSENMFAYDDLHSKHTHIHTKNNNNNNNNNNKH